MYMLAFQINAPGENLEKKNLRAEKLGVICITHTFPNTLTVKDKEEISGTK